MMPSRKPPLLYLISDGDFSPSNYASKEPEFLELVRLAVAAEISLVQIREKQLSAQQVYKLTQNAVEITRAGQTKILVNDRADIALAANADGVHLTANSLSTIQIRRHFGDRFLIGVSAHSPDEVLPAKNAGADFATFSPVFFTPSKAQYGEPQGLENLANTCRIAGDFPVLALGGIDESNFASALKTGAGGIAAIRWLNDAKNLAQIVKSIRDER